MVRVNLCHYSSFQACRIWETGRTLVDGISAATRREEEKEKEKKGYSFQYLIYLTSFSQTRSDSIVENSSLATQNVYAALHTVTRPSKDLHSAFVSLATFAKLCSKCDLGSSRPVVVCEQPCVR